MEGILKLHLVTAKPATKFRLRSCLGDRWDISLHKVYQLQLSKSFRFKGKISLVLEEGVNFLRLLVNPIMYRRNAVLAAEHSHYSTLLFGKWLKLLGVSRKVFLFNFYLHGLGKYRAIRCILNYLLKQDVRLMVQSKSELSYFKQLNSEIDVQFSPYCRAEITDVDPSKVWLGDYIFAGGYTNRDYDLLLRCATKLPEQEFVIVCSRLNVITAAVPSNVKILRDIPSKEFHSLIAGSKFVVVPLLDDVGSSGQMVALAAMQFGKMTIYPDFEVIGQYFENKKSGLMYRAGDADSLLSVLNFAKSSPDQLVDIGAQARLRRETCFRPENFVKALCDCLNEFIRREH